MRDVHMADPAAGSDGDATTCGDGGVVTLRVVVMERDFFCGERIIHGSRMGDVRMTGVLPFALEFVWVALVSAESKCC